jgi:hypothetical protein
MSHVTNADDFAQRISECCTASLDAMLNLYPSRPDAEIAAMFDCPPEHTAGFMQFIADRRVLDRSMRAAYAAKLAA